MSSNEMQNDLPKSTKNLFTLLSGSLNLKSQQFIATELERNSKQLISGLLYYESYDSVKDSLVELKKQKMDSIPVELLAKMSLYLNLNAIQTNELFESYLMYEFKGTPEMVKSLFTNEKHVKQLMNQLWHYYYSERIFSLFCLKQILSHWKHSSAHVYHQIFHGFLEAINGDNKLLTRLLQQLNRLNDSPVPSRLTNGPYFSESLAKSWLLNNLKEQIEVLELLLLYFKEFEPSIDNIIEMLTTFKCNGFGSKFTHFTRSDCELIDEEVFKFIGFLESLVIVECLDLNWLFKCHSQDIEHHLINEPNAHLVKQLDSMVTNLNTSVVEHSPIFMAWMIVRSWESPHFDATLSSQLVSQLGSNALQLNIFSYLEKCLHSSQMIALRGTVVSDLIYGAIGGLLSVTFSVYDIEMLGYSIPSLNHLCITLFKNNFISKDVFENGLDFGLGIIIRSALDNFPYKANPVLSFCHSLSETETCKHIYEKLCILSNLTTYAEPFDSSLTSCVPTQQESVYMLIKDKMLFHNCELILNKDTKGLLRIFNNNRVIEWKDINIDGWKVLHHRFKETYDLVSRGQLYSVTEIAINEMSQITSICSNLIKHNCFQHISTFNKLISLCFESFELFSSLQNPFRIFMASVLELSANIIKSNLQNVTSIWIRITEKKFMPYMIGLTTNLRELITGNDTNTSILGQVIASEECIKGYYQLCISFLKLIVEVVKKSELKDDNNLMASIIYVIQELFPSHYFWNYKNRNDFFIIGRLCFDIFYHILAKTSKKGERTKIQQICISALMEGSAAEALLKVIKNGESTVRNVILNGGNDISLTNDDQIIIVRQSLSILSYLLVLHRSAKSPATVVENALFTSQSKPNMLLILSHYVFQRYDTHLATLAIQLLKQLSKRFPMSMLACLGSDAEAMRDHFLYRLEEVTEDLNLKIALLNLLSSCVEHQPGLMEMFLNVDNENDMNTTGCLQTVLETLTEKREAKYFCPIELHLASLKFLYTFWLQPHLLAIDSLKKTNNVWTLITFPLFVDSNFENTLCIYILRILAREIFYVKTLERDKFDCDLENKFKILRESDQLKKLSSHICSLINCNQIQEDSIQLLDAWKDFLVSIAKFDPFNISTAIKTTILNDLMDCLLTQLKAIKINNNTITTLSDTILIILIKWKETCITCEDEYNSKICELLSYANEAKDVLSFYAIISIEALVIEYLQLFPNQYDSSQWILSSAALLNLSLRIIDKQMKFSLNSLQIEFKLAVTSVLLLQSLVFNNSSRVSVWINVFRSYLVIESLANLLIYLIDNKVGVELANHIMSFFIILSSIKTCAEALVSIGCVENVCLSLQNTYHNVSDSNPKMNWTHVFHLSFKMIINLTNELKHHFIDIAITYVAVHLDHFVETLTKLRTSPKMIEMQESILIVTLCHSISRYHQIWRKNHSLSYETIQSQILKTSNSVIAFLIRPNLLSYIMENPQTSTAAIITSDITPKKLSPNQSLHKAVSWETDFTSHSIDTNVHNSLLTLQAFSIAFLQNVSPNVLELMEKQGINGHDWHLLLNASFSSPNIDPNISLSFGSLINCIHMCIKSVNRSERAVNDSEQPKQITGKSDFLTFIFEMSLSFMVSQALVAQLSPIISSVDKQIIAREIKSELSTILSNAGFRQSKRTSQSTIAIVSTPRSPTLKVIERSFVKFLLQFVDKISQ